MPSASERGTPTEDLATRLAERLRDGTAVRIAGAGTKAGWGHPVEGLEPLPTAGLDAIVSHDPGDFTAVVQAGVPLARAQAAFAEHDQMLALDPPDPGGATLGGVVATADAGPLRHRYGAARDLVIGITLALADGTVARSGGRVIKNVAGYDLPKLASGSFGTLGMITEVCLRLHPRPSATATAVLRRDEPADLGATTLQLAARPLEADALDVRLDAGGGAVLVRFGGAAAAERAAALADELEGGETVTDDDELWAAQRAGQRSADGVVLQVGGMPASLAKVLRAGREHGATTAVGRAGVGTTWLTLPAGTGADAVTSLRAALAPDPSWSPTRPPSCARPSTRGACPKGPSSRSCAASRSASTQTDTATRASSPEGSDRDGHHRLPARARLRRLLQDCVHCGFCLPTCPTYVLGAEEMDSPRGRIVLMKELQDGELSPQLVTHIDRCLSCMACTTACPSGVRYDLLINDTRAEIERRTTRSLGERLKRRAVFAMFPHHRRMRALIPLLPFAKLGRPIPKLRELSRLAPERPPRLAPMPDDLPARGESRGRVGFLQGCVQRAYFPHVNRATVEVLRAEGWDVHAPADLACCGSLELHAGEAQRAAKRAADTVEAFEDDEIVVTNAAGCGSGMKENPRDRRQGPRRHRAAGRARAARHPSSGPPAGRLPRRLPPRPRPGRARAAAQAAAPDPGPRDRRARGLGDLLRLGRHLQPDPARRGGRARPREGRAAAGHRRRGDRRRQPGLHAADPGASARARPPAAGLPPARAHPPIHHGSVHMTIDLKAPPTRRSSTRPR